MTKCNKCNKLRCEINVSQQKDYEKLDILETRTLSILHFRLVGFRLDVLGLRDPVQITPEIVLDLLLLSQFVEITPRLCLLPLLGEFAAPSKGTRLQRVRRCD